jgi:two-component system CheB/CheR fusion protein
LTSPQIHLATAGFYVAGACGGQEAIDAASSDSPDVALVDLAMPGVDGFEVARRIREGSARPPVLVAVAGPDWDRDRERVDAAGFVLCLTKPVPPRELVAAVRECARVRAPE